MTSTSIATGIVASVNVSAIRTIEIDGAEVTTGIFKLPVAGRVPLHGVNLAGDDQADRNAHGGPDQAVYAYAAEDYEWWSAEPGRVLAPGTFGENLTLRGIDVSGARIGERWRIGSTLLQVTAPRVPCFKLAHVMNDPRFVRDFARALLPGAYLRILEEGDIACGDSVEIVGRPSHELTIADMARIYFFERKRVRDMLVAPELTDSWRAWATEHAT
jgi:MOSC domain-containing protein YiiM